MILYILTYSGYPDEMLQNVASHLGLHCLSMYMYQSIAPIEIRLKIITDNFNLEQILDSHMYIFFIIHYSIPKTPGT